ncbi:ABC-type multidrug transport system, ATPase component [Amycolatopsis pretoriensis]|uniref:ABC-type multidrug transport system, ATPase component n=1 Tax=Amycolatopsis pretoriensis TaxID=218821 RepID=A0A1H5QN30_9PSEU|nr:ABC transporter ATP-binding protein [Amycolatopsis pretoriensis]SEF27455.1 ABC-type multidrug transport system, ATPase component [Amycolatopsis pretoriensis]
MRAVEAAEVAPATYAWEIRAEALKVRVGRRKMAVDGLDLSLGKGVHGLLGPNGAGKTTLIRALATVLRPASGTLTLLGGTELRALRRRIGYLPQNFGYYKRFTVREFVEYLAWLKEMSKEDIPGAVQRAIERVGLADRANDRMRTLSGGMVRRVGIAQAIVNDPDILLLDEPTAGLDPAQRVRFRELMQELGQDSCVLISTHLVEDVATACTDVVLFADGKLVFQGSPAELAAAGSADDVGDSPIERGYSALLKHEPGKGAW